MSVYMTIQVRNEIRAVLNNTFNKVKILIGHSNFILAGGCVRDICNGDEPRDIDVFFLNESDYLEACINLDYSCKMLKERRNSKVYMSKDETELDLVYPDTIKELNDSNIMSIFSDIQPEPTGKDVIRNFDFADGQQYFDGSELVMTMMCTVAMERKEILINQITFPYLSLGRASKMRKRGWEVSRPVLEALAEHCMNAPFGPGAELEYSF
jgi:hypothetical protein